MEDVVEKRSLAYQIHSAGEGGVYKWDTERALSQAVIMGDRVAKVEIAKKAFDERIGNSTME